MAADRAVPTEPQAAARLVQSPVPDWLTYSVTGGCAPAVFNAANEVAVAAFLGGRIAWSAISEVVSDTLDRYDAPGPTVGRTVEDVLDADATARRLASDVVAGRDAP